MTFVEEVERLLAPIVATAGVELVEVVYHSGNLRVVIDREGGIDTESLTQVSRLISPILDQNDPVPGRYTLEVSSPGLERPLRKLSHFERAVGEEIVAKMVGGSEKRRYRGELAQVHSADGTDGETITIKVKEIDGVELAEPETQVLSLDKIDKARTVFSWGPSPKPGKGGAKKTGSGAQHKKNKSRGMT